jgi:hypothetical protein
MLMQFDPPWTPVEALETALRRTGYALLDPVDVGRWSGSSADQLAELARFWEHLPLDPHLRDGGRYRRRRHSCCIIEDQRIEPVAHRAHWQPLSYNALHGGMQRWFEPIESAMLAHPAWALLLRALARTGSSLHEQRRWYVEAHPFRIDTADGIGRPTPEGAHRDGVDLVAIFMIDRHAIKGGETRVFDASGPNGLRFTLPGPWSLLLLDDHRVIHESTPIQPEHPDGLGWRDTLVVTLRGQGFQDAPDDA